MGMFDYIVCEAPLPVDGLEGRRFQTKFREWGDRFLETFRITADGRLLHEACDYSFEPDETKEGLMALCGALKRKNERVVEVPYHGDIYFYDFREPADPTSEWLEFRARFTDGRLASITRENDEPASPDSLKASSDPSGTPEG